jgi:hypothetical protein
VASQVGWDRVAIGLQGQRNCLEARS